ncbi:MAG: WecB/TagA/CpsF family glycosyltransferase [Polyangia bacterium]|jgi:N-acetylglucosaminyldiphosphoundecaprenol N-acetyl-beta-D-mannosaminyltransferase
MAAKVEGGEPGKVLDVVEVATVSIMGLRLARLGGQELLDHMFVALAAGRGGWLVTANLDFLRRYTREEEARALYDAADLRVADGMPLVWACRLQGCPLPERIAGSSLVWLLAIRAEAEGRSIYLLGGTPRANAGACRVLRERYPRLELCGGSSPVLASPPSPQEIEELAAELSRHRPDIVLVALGSPKQEQVIKALRDRLPATWMIGVGVSLSFVAGELRRAPLWMRGCGLEWLHRMFQEPRRLAKRYLLHDLPFALRLFPHAIMARWRGGRR